MTEPTWPNTDSGTSLLQEFASGALGEHSDDDDIAHVRERILAIEAEARADALREAQAAGDYPAPPAAPPPPYSGPRFICYHEPPCGHYTQSHLDPR